MLQALDLERLLDLDLHLLDFERLLHVVEGADLHRLDGGVDRSERGHQDHGGGRMQRARRAQHVECRRCRPSSGRSARRRSSCRAAARWRRCRWRLLRLRVRLPSVRGRAPAAARRDRRQSEFGPYYPQSSTWPPAHLNQPEALVTGSVTRNRVPRRGCCSRRCGRRARRRSSSRSPGQGPTPGAWS